MRKTTVKLLLPLGLAAIIPTALAQNNGDEYYSVPFRTFTFDTQPYNLASWQRSKSNIVFKNGGTEGRLGSKCLTVDCSKSHGNAYGTYIYNVPCTPGKKLLIAVWCKVSQDFSEKATAGLEVEFYNANNKRIPTDRVMVTLPADKRNGVWQRLAARVEAPAGTKIMRVCLPVRNAAAGKVWYDDLCIAAMPDNFDPAIEASYSELIHEATFDKHPLNWPSWQNAQAGVVFNKSVPEGRSNSKCLTMDFAKANNRFSGVYLNLFPCQAGKKYMFSAWFKVSEQVKADAFVAADVVFMDSSKKIFKTTPQSVQLNTLNHGSWQRIVLFFEAPENAKNMRVHFTARHAVPGKVWLDDITIKAMP